MSFSCAEKGGIGVLNRPMISLYRIGVELYVSHVRSDVTESISYNCVIRSDDRRFNDWKRGFINDRYL
jgi:hypothetical protein